MTVKPSPGPPAGFRIQSGAGKIGELVGGKKKDRRVRFKAMLGAVAVMDIPVDNEHPFEAQVFSCRHSRDGHIVEQTIAHGPVSFRMMTGGADQGKKHCPDHQSQPV